MSDFYKYVPFKDGEASNNRTHLKISVGYQKGGVNWYNGQHETGGIYVYFTPVRKEQWSVSQILGEGYKIHVADSNRKNTRKMEKIFNALEPKMDALKDFYVAEDKQAIFALLNETAASI